ncbi:MAG: hypothetical protein WCA46_21630 [Actinocatenispora sp.]
MGDFFELKDAGAVLSRSGQLKNAAAQLRTKLQSIHGDITANEGPDAWGDDKHGEEFTKNYGDGTKGAGADARKASADLPDDLDRTGRAVTEAASSALMTDAGSRTDIQNAAGD